MRKFKKNVVSCFSRIFQEPLKRIQFRKVLYRRRKKAQLIPNLTFFVSRSISDISIVRQLTCANLYFRRNSPIAPAIKIRIALPN